MEPIIVAFSNRKGGVGKTTLASLMAAECARRGIRTLLIDADGQGSLTQGLLGPAGYLDQSAERSLAALFATEGTEPDQAELIVPTAVVNLWLLPSSLDLEQFNQPGRHDAPDLNLSLFLRDLEGFDLILIDCPPNLSRLTTAAWIAAHCLIVPLIPEDYSAQGIPHLQDKLRRTRQHNPRLRLAGYLLTMVHPITIHKAFEKKLRSGLGRDVFARRVYHRAAIKEAIVHRMPLHKYRPSSAAVEEVVLVADEFLERIGYVAKPSAKEKLA